MQMKILHEKIIHIQLKKKKVKNVGLLYYGKQLLNVESRKTISFMGQCIFYKINDNQ